MALQKYNVASGVPHSGENYLLTPEYWVKSAYKAKYHDFVFRDLIGPERSGKMIIFNAKELGKGGKQSTVAMRLNAEPNTYPVRGPGQIVKYSDLSGSAVQTMSYAKMQIYADYERYAWGVNSDMDEFIVKYLEYSRESAVYLGELHRQREEESVIHTMLYGLSPSVSIAKGAASVDSTPTYVGHLQKMPPSFKRLWSASYGVSHNPHPNTYFINEANNTALAAAIAADSADITFEAVVDSMVSDAVGDFSLAAIDAAHRLAHFHKIKPVMTPHGPRWIWFVPSVAGTDLRTLFRTIHQAAGPRDYGSNRLWSGILGDYMGFLFVESEYIKPLITDVANYELSDATYGYDNGASNGTMTLDVTDANAVIYPTFVCGQEVMAFAEPQPMDTEEEHLDGNKKHFRFAGRHYGLRRADFFKDTTTDYFSGGANATSLVSNASGIYGTKVVWNWSSMLIMCRATEPGI